LLYSFDFLEFSPMNFLESNFESEKKWERVREMERNEEKKGEREAPFRVHEVNRSPMVGDHIKDCFFFFFLTT